MEAKQARSARDLRHFVAGSFVRRLPLAAAMAVLAVSACNEGTTAPPPDPNEPALVEILQDGSQILVGNQRSFSAEVRTADGTVLSSAGVVWTSGSSNVVTVDGNGVVRAVGGGQSQVFATAGLALDAITITVPAPAGAVSNPGGWVETPDGVVRVDVPMNAVSAEVEITIVAAHPDSLPASSTALAGTAFEFAPAGLAFATPATLTIRYDPALTNVLEARRLRVHKLTGGAWSPVEGGAVDTASTSVSGMISSFSIYAVAPIPNQSPVVTISAPESGSEVASGLAIDFSGTGLDAEDGAVTGESLTWASSLDGALGTGATVTRSDLSIGDHVVSLTAMDSEGAEGVAEVAITIVDGPPIVEILAPSVDTVVKVGDAVTFAGTATDHVEGAIPGDSLTWTSSVDGSLGTGASIVTSTLSVGDHVITLTAPDRLGNTGVDSVSVSVKANDPPAVFITNPNGGATVGDRTGVTFIGSAADPEDGPLTGTALVWSSSLDGVLGTGTSLAVSTLTIGAHSVTLTATDSDGATGNAVVAFTVSDEPPPLLYPQLVYVGEAAGTLTLSVSNSGSYDNELFVLTPTLPPCSVDPNPSRTWIEVYDGAGTLLNTFCDFDDRSDMASFSFTPADPPPQIYIELWDRVEDRRIRSGSVVPIPTVGTTIEGIVANDRDSDLNTLDPGEALSGVTLKLIVDANADGVIDPGEVTWATTSTDSKGAYSFSDLWERNYIVQAVSPSSATVLRALSATGSIVDQTGTLLTTAVVGAGATLNQSGTNQVGTTNPPGQGDELPRWGYTLGTAAADTGLEPSGPGPNSTNGALTTAPTHFIFLYNTGELSGSVKTGGVGVPGARVTVSRCQTAGAEPSPPAAGACTLKHGTPSPHIMNVDTDASGNYSVANLLEGIYQIDVAPQTAGYANVLVPAGPASYLAVIRGNGDNAMVPDFSIN